MKKLKKIMCVILATVLIFGLGACKKEEQAEPVLSNADDESVYKNLTDSTLWLSAYDFDTFNPLSTVSKSVADCSFLVYDSLFYLDDTLSANGVLANGYSVSADKKTYTINLNTNFKFHDGTNFSSADVVYTINEIKRLGAKSLFYEYVENIESVSSSGANSVLIKIYSPEPLFINNLVFPIVKKNTSSDEKITAPIGTGPYKFVKTNLIRAMYFERNENYAGTRGDGGKIRNAVVTFVPDRKTQTYALETRRSDAACVTAKELANYNPKGLVKTSYHSNRRLTFIGINSTGAVLSDVAVRRAVSLAIDRKDIINSVLFGNGEAVLLPFDKNCFVYPSKYKDESKKASDAASELANAGWIADKDGILTKTDENGKKIRASISLLVNSESDERMQTAKKISESLKQIGIDVKISKTDFASYKAKTESGNYEMYIGEVYMNNSFSTDKLFGDSAIFSIYYSETLNNAAYRKKTAYTKEETIEAFENLSDCLTEQMPIVCLYFSCDAMIANNRLNCTNSLASGSEFANLRAWTKEVN